jgi:hypothetical protein
MWFVLYFGKVELITLIKKSIDRFTQSEFVYRFFFVIFVPTF